MTDQGKSLKLVAGAAQLGNWKSYKLVLYRLYYEDREGRRKSMLIPSRLGFLAVAAGLAHITGADYVILSLVTPLTLATIAGNSRRPRETLSRVRTAIVREFCGNVINGIEKAISPKEGVESSNGKIINISISECGERDCKLALRVSKGRAGENDEEVGIERGSVPVLVIKGLAVRDGIKGRESGGGEWRDLPQICNYDCELHYEVCGHRGEKIERDRRVRLTLYIITVPLNMAVGLQDGNIVLFREESPEKLDMEFVLRASILEGLTHSLVRDIEEKVRGRINNLTNLDVMLFYDTTHGSNTIIPPLAHAVKSLDNVVALRIASTLLENLKAGDDRLPTVSFRTYFYNSDPVSIGKPSEFEFFKTTAEGGGINYYYRKLVDATLPLGSLAVEEGERLRRELSGLINRMAGLRGLIDELVSLIPTSVSGLNKIERRAVKYIFIAYLARLGLFHWVVASAEKPDLAGEPIKLVELKVPLGEGDGGSKRILHVTYKRSQHIKRLDPYTLVAGLEVCGSLASYLLALYEAFSRFDGHRGGGSNGNHKVCLTLEALRNLLESVEWKAGKVKDAGSGDAGAAKQYLSNLLILSTPYEGVVDPSVRIILLNEIARLMRNPERVLSYFVPEFLELKMRRDISEIAPLPEEVCGERVICLYPITRLQPIIDDVRSVRNFIAHGGLTRLSNDWCIAVKGSSTGNTAKCVTHAICIDRPLPDDVLLKMIKLVS